MNAFKAIHVFVSITSMQFFALSFMNKINIYECYVTHIHRYGIRRNTACDYPFRLNNLCSVNGDAANDSNNGDIKQNQDDVQCDDLMPFLLPAIGQSSAWKTVSDCVPTMDSHNDTSSYFSEEKSDTGRVPMAYVGSAKFELQYTCKVCNTRNKNKISRLGKFSESIYFEIIVHDQHSTFIYIFHWKAYRKGVVIAVCKGCKSKHLIADNLGWSNYLDGFDGESNIEEFLMANGRGEDVNRVSSTVWELENNLGEGDEYTNENGIYDMEDNDRSSFE